MTERFEPILLVERLTKRYPGQPLPAVDGLSFRVAPGEIYGLLGPNGAGKTTCISILSTLLEADAGRVQLAGIDLRQQPGKIRRLIGVVPQELALYPSLSGRENLNYFGRLLGLKGKQLQQRVDWALQLVGLLKQAGQPLARYSGGMKRRANLAAGILHRPRLLFLDEPTVGIDAQSRNLILENLQQLNREGMTMIYTTHYMEEAQQLCHRVGVIDQGQLLVEGVAQQLVEQENCQNLEQLFLKLTGKALRD